MNPGISLDYQNEGDSASASNYDYAFTTETLVEPLSTERGPRFVVPRPYAAKLQKRMKKKYRVSFTKETNHKAGFSKAHITHISTKKHNSNKNKYVKNHELYSKYKKNEHIPSPSLRLVHHTSRLEPRIFEMRKVQKNIITISKNKRVPSKKQSIKSNAFNQIIPPLSENSNNGKNRIERWHEEIIKPGELFFVNQTTEDENQVVDDNRLTPRDEEKGKEHDLHDNCEHKLSKGKAAIESKILALNISEFLTKKKTEKNTSALTNNIPIKLTAVQKLDRIRNQSNRWTKEFAKIEKEFTFRKKTINENKKNSTSIINVFKASADTSAGNRSQSATTVNNVVSLKLNDSKSHTNSSSNSDSSQALGDIRVKAISSNDTLQNPNQITASKYPNFPMPSYIPLPLFYNSGESSGATSDASNLTRDILGEGEESSPNGDFIENSGESGDWVEHMIKSKI